MSVAILNCVVWESTTSVGTSVQRAEGDRVGSKALWVFLGRPFQAEGKAKEKSLGQHSRQKKMQMQKPEAGGGRGFLLGQEEDNRK